MTDGGQLATQDATIAIVGGTGSLGHGLALRWALAGLTIRIGSRDAERARESAAKVDAAVTTAGASAPAVGSGEYTQVVAGADIVVLTVPFRVQSEHLNNLRDALTPGQIVVDCTVPLAAAVSGKATRSLGVWQGSAAQQAAEMLPDTVDVVAGFHTVSARNLAKLDVELDEDILLCSDSAPAKARVAELVEAIDGLRPVDAGPLEQARIAEQMTALLISVNARHRTRSGIKLTRLGDVPFGGPQR